MTDGSLSQSSREKLNPSEPTATYEDKLLACCGIVLFVLCSVVDRAYIRLIARFRNIFDFVNRSFQLSRGLIPPTRLFKFEDVFLLNGTFGISLTSLFLIMEDSIFLMACSHSHCAMVTYLRVKDSFILVGTCVHAIIITCDAFKSMIANSVDFAFSYTF